MTFDELRYQNDMAYVSFASYKGEHAKKNAFLSLTVKSKKEIKIKIHILMHCIEKKELISHYRG